MARDTGSKKRVQLPAVPATESFCNFAQAGTSAEIHSSQHATHRHTHRHTHTQTCTIAQPHDLIHMTAQMFSLLENPQQFPDPSTILVIPSSVSPWFLPLHSTCRTLLQSLALFSVSPPDCELCRSDFSPWCHSPG